MLWTKGSSFTQVTFVPGSTCRIDGVKHALAIRIVPPEPWVAAEPHPPPAQAGSAARVIAADNARPAAVARTMIARRSIPHLLYRRPPEYTARVRSVPGDQPTEEARRRASG